MKIKINEQETYEIVIDNGKEYTFEEFLQLIGKLVKISKIISTDTPLPLTKNDPTKMESVKPQEGLFKKKQRGKARIQWNRDLAVEAVKTHYHATKEEKEAFAQSQNVPDWNYLLKAMSILKRRFNITPSEVGMTAFPIHHLTERALKKKNILEGYGTPSQTPQPPLELKEDNDKDEEKEKKIEWEY